jgi:hypothetical protein
MDGGHSDSSHGLDDACTHAVDHYNHAMHDLSTHTGHAVDSIFGQHNYHDHSVGQMTHDAMNVYGAQQEMNAACGSSGDSGSSGW